MLNAALKLFAMSACAGVLVVCLHLSYAIPQFQVESLTLSKQVSAELSRQGTLLTESQRLAQELLAAALMEITGSPELPGKPGSGRASLRDDLLYHVDMNLGWTNRVLQFTACGLVGTPVDCGPEPYRWGAVPLAAASIVRAARAVESAGHGARQIEDQVSDLMTEMTDCEAVGASCFQNRFFNTTAAMQRMAEDGSEMFRHVSLATPQFLESAQRNSDNIERTTENVGRITDRFAGRRGALGWTWEGIKAGAFVFRCAALFC